MKKLQLQTKITVGSIAGLLLALAFENSKIWFILPIVFSIWWGLSHRRSLSDYLALSFSFSLVFWAIHIIWIISIGVDAYILLTILMTCIYGTSGYFMYLIRNSYLPFLGYALIFIGIETFVQFFPFGGFPWAKIAYAAIDSPFVNLAPIGSTPLVAMSIFVISIFLIPFAGFILQKAIYPTLFFAIIIGSFLYYLQNIKHFYTHVGSSNLLIVQGSVPRTGLLFNQQKLAVLSNHINETKRYLEENDQINIDAILWPENSIDVDPRFNNEARISIDNLLTSTEYPIIAGAVLNESESLKNSVILMQDKFENDQKEYIKKHLVPFGEYLPFRRFLENKISRFNLLSKDFQRGQDKTNFIVKSTVISPIICFEVAWNDYLSKQIIDGGQLISVHTNNATYAFSKQIMQQFQITRFRAIETGRQTIISATTGISAHINESGQVIWQSDEFIPQSHLAQVKLINEITPAIKQLDKINLSVIILVFITLLNGLINSMMRKP